MAQLPTLKTGNTQTDLWISRSKSLLDKVLLNKMVNGVLLQNVTLSPGSNTINHTLNRTQIGWSQVDLNGPAMIWRTGAFNATNLILNCSATAAVSVNLWVF